MYEIDNPRLWIGADDHFHMWHRKYSFGDADTPKKPIPDEELDKISVWLPVYMYDHSGITISTSPFSCKWDSGRIGYIYMTKEDIRRIYNVKRIGKRTKSDVLHSLIISIIEVDDWLQGDNDDD